MISIVTVQRGPIPASNHHRGPPECLLRIDFWAISSVEQHFQILVAKLFQLLKKLPAR